MFGTITKRKIGKNYSRKEILHRYYLKHRESELERTSKWRKEHPDKMREYWKKYRQKDSSKKKRSFYQRRRSLKKLNNGGTHTLGEWETLKAQYNWTCPFCKKQEPKIKLTEDHIIPISKGGSDNIENIQPLCLACNGRKGNKL